MTKLGTLWLCGVAGALCLGARLVFDRWRAVTVGLGVALVLILLSFWSLRWAFSKSNKVFFSVYAGGFLARLAGFAATAAVVILRFRDQAPAVLLSLAAGLLVLSWVESLCILKRASS